MRDIVVYSKDDCPWCVKAKDLLTKYNFKYVEKKYGVDFTREDLYNLVGPDKKLTVPQVIINGELVGGYEDLAHHFERHNIFGVQS